jgi:hypothetical protein
LESVSSVQATVAGETMSNHYDFPVPFHHAPYHTHHIVGMDDFKTTNLCSYVRHNAHSINKAVYTAAKERKSNQAITCKLDPPFRIWLTEKEIRRKDYIKFKFEKRGLAKRPHSHLVTKKELKAHHMKNEVDDYHLSQHVEVCDHAIHPDHKLSSAHPHANMYHHSDVTLQRMEHVKSLNQIRGPHSKSPPANGNLVPPLGSKSPGRAQSASMSRLPPVGPKSPEPKKSLW